MKLVALALLVAAVAAGCGSTTKKSSNGFGAATQPPPAAQTGVSTSQETPKRRKYRYPRKLARQIQVACLGTGRSTAVCACVLDELENTLPPAKLGATGVEARIKRLTSNCPKT